MNGTDYLVEVMTQWASLPLALALLGAMLLAWYQVDRSSSDIDRYEAPNDNWDPGQLHSFELCLASALSHVRRMRFAVVCVAVIAVATAGASIARLAWEFYDAGLGALGQGVQWYTYAEIVIGCIAVVIPALACIVLGPSCGHAVLACSRRLTTKTETKRSKTIRWVRSNPEWLSFSATGTGSSCR
jgi:hypothetical protein